MWTLIKEASWIVQGVLLILFISSILSWGIFFEKFFKFKKIQLSDFLFEKDLKNDSPLSISRKHSKSPKAYLLEQSLSSKNLNQEFNYHLDKMMLHLESKLYFLAMIANIAPFLGLFGTVWGIMETFKKMGESANFQVIAPMLSEALFATAVGLFVAIPASFFYNYLSDLLSRKERDLKIFQEVVRSFHEKKTSF